jgi:hypothetical protein
MSSLSHSSGTLMIHRELAFVSVYGCCRIDHHRCSYLGRISSWLHIRLVAWLHIRLVAGTASALSTSRSLSLETITWRRGWRRQSQYSWLSKRGIYITLELASGGELFDKIVRRFPSSFFLVGVIILFPRLCMCYIFGHEVGDNVGQTRS